MATIILLWLCLAHKPIHDLEQLVVPNILQGDLGSQTSYQGTTRQCLSFSLFRVSSL